MPDCAYYFKGYQVWVNKWEPVVKERRALGRYMGAVALPDNHPCKGILPKQKGYPKFEDERYTAAGWFYGGYSERPLEKISLDEIYRDTVLGCSAEIWAIAIHGNDFAELIMRLNRIVIRLRELENCGFYSDVNGDIVEVKKSIAGR